ncbi:hypothetical protein [Fusobacterium ulcerans]|uniref:hypothetical protein n=1 Tax=Fusobacterium ulcerans TaxID=861 RepID=UPI003FEF2D58
MRKRKLFLILFPLFLGIGIYLLYRSRNLFYFKLIHSTFLSKPVLHIRDFAKLYRKMFSTWVVYSLPDGLWLFSFGAALLVDRIFYFYDFVVFTSIYIGMIALEFLQLYFGGHGSVIGTFDTMDIFFFTLGYLSIVLISKYYHKKNPPDKSMFTIENKKKEVLYNTRTIITFIILGILPSLL